ncbi:hypothetical protein AK812_SmicGene9613 [Symbiodinium microadriaticum]|uniref:Uncharacterized protein n=1 Tax=Symbiodinium microadriaticum TaxID=2951 RepID=A0A1Q9EHU4_SYMMI|nr:hypothetical protein AK812_SmicGene9613 [Symbiodinium microadriaticum]
MPFVAADVFSHDERAMSSTRTVDSPGIIGWVSRVDDKLIDSLLFVRADSGHQRQADVKQLQPGRIPLKVPLQCSPLKPVTVEVKLMQRIAKARIALPGGDRSQKFIAELETLTGGRSPPAIHFQVKSCRGGAHQPMPSSQSVEQLRHLIAALLRTVLRERPVDPLASLASHFQHDRSDCAGDTESEPFLAGQAQTQIVVDKVTGAPSDAVLSIMAWKAQVLLPVGAIPEGGMKLHFAEGPAGLNPFRIDLLMPLCGDEVVIRGMSDALPQTRQLTLRHDDAEVVVVIERGISKLPNRDEAEQSRASDCWPQCLAWDDPVHLTAAVEFAREYLAKHRLDKFLLDMLTEASAQPPADVYAFAAARLAEAQVCQAENGSQGNCAVGAHGRVDLDCAQLMHALSTNSADSTGISHSYDEIQPLPAGRESMATTETEEMQEPPQSHGTGSHTTAAQADQIEGESWNNLPVEIADAAYLDGTLDAAAHPVQSEPMNGEPQGYFAPTESEQMGTDQCIQGLFLHVEGPGLEAEHQSQQADGTLAAGHDARPAQSEQIEAELPGNHNASAELEGEVSAASHGSIHVETAPNLPQQEQTGHGETQNQSDPAQPVQVEVEPQSSQTVFESQESGQVDDKPETGDDATAAQADQIEGESWNNLPVEIADAAYLDGTLDAAAHPVQSEPMNGEPQGYFAPTESEQMGTDQCIQGLFLHVEGPGLEAEHQSQQADGTLAAGHDARPAQSEQIEAELPGNHNPSAEFEPEQIWEDLEGMHESANVGEILCESDAKPSQLVQAQGYLQNTSLYASGENELPEAHAQAHSHMHQPGQSALEEASETSHGIHAGAFPTDAQPGLQQLQQHWTPAALSPDAEQEASEAWHGSMCVDEMPPSHAETDQGQERPQIHASLHEFVLSGPVLSDPETQMQVQALQVAGFSQQDIVPHDVAVGSWTTIQQPPWLPTQAANSLSVCGCSHSDSVSAGWPSAEGRPSVQLTPRLSGFMPELPPSAQSANISPEESALTPRLTCWIPVPGL